MSNKILFDTVLNDCNITLEFYWDGDEPDWDSMDVIALLPGVCEPESKYWVKINDTISDNDWNKLESEIYFNEDELRKQVRELE
jgi:hypothetical protein